MFTPGDLNFMMEAAMTQAHNIIAKEIQRAEAKIFAELQKVHADTMARLFRKRPNEDSGEAMEHKKRVVDIGQQLMGSNASSSSNPPPPSPIATAAIATLKQSAKPPGLSEDQVAEWVSHKTGKKIHSSFHNGYSNWQSAYEWEVTTEWAGWRCLLCAQKWATAEHVGGTKHKDAVTKALKWGTLTV